MRASDVTGDVGRGRSALGRGAALFAGLGGVLGGLVEPLTQGRFAGAVVGRVLRCFLGWGAGLAVAVALLPRVRARR